MAGPIVDRTDSSAPPSQWIVLVAVAFGLLFGALTCAAGVARGVAHGATQPSVLEIDELSMAHAGHGAPMVAPTSHSTPLEDHGDHSGSTPMAGDHPGMACVVSVDLHAPEASSASPSGSYEPSLFAMNTECPADVDPPVPRLS